VLIKEHVGLLKEAIRITDRGASIVALIHASNFGMQKFRDFTFKVFNAYCEQQFCRRGRRV